MASTSAALAVVCLAAGLLHLVRLARLRRDVVRRGLVHGRALGMSAMFSPLGDPVPTAVWPAVFVLAAVGLVAAPAMLLAGHVAWHALRWADRCRTTCPDAHPAVSVQDGRDGPNAAVALRAPAFSACAPQTAAVSHVVLAAAMTAMLLRTP
jgi:hypothetical protein